MDDQFKGQMSIDDWFKIPEATIDFSSPDPGAKVYETPAAEEMKMQLVDLEPEAAVPIEYGTRSCEVCAWRTKENKCHWAHYERRGNKPEPVYRYPECDGYGSFMPSHYMVPGMCASCKWSNSFHYETKPEYEEYQNRTGKRHREAFHDPVEEPNIYCTHPEGSLNRRTAYKDIEWEGFGACHWDRQHEWDTCDRWEPERGPYIDYTKYFPEWKDKKYWEGKKKWEQSEQQSSDLSSDQSADS